MSGLRLFCFKQFFKLHVFVLVMLVIFRLFMNVHFGGLLWGAFVISFCNVSLHLAIKPFKITGFLYVTTAVSGCVSLTIISWRFLLVALGIDVKNMLYFLCSMVLFGGLVYLYVIYKKNRNKQRRKRRTPWHRKLRYMGWVFLLFLFFYQLILSYLLRPNFLTVMALTVSHLNLLLIMWTYFDVKQLCLVGDGYANKSNKTRSMRR